MTYNPNKIERKIYNFWENNNFFKTKINFKKKNFCIILPPPNITGNLHIGHAFQHSIMDAIIRFKRMNKINTLWQPGFDHAGIATQILIKKKYKNQKLNKKNFINKTNIWKNNLSKSIINQMKLLGNSIYWKNIRFTMDSKFKNSVSEVFIKLYNDNLIYKKKSIVNVDTNLKTVISDIETLNIKIKSNIWYIKLKILEINEYIIIPTSKPETILEISCIIINYNNKQYNLLKNKHIIIPILNNIIPIIINNNLIKNNDFRQLIPSKSIEDYKIAIKYSLPIINIFNDKLKIGKFIEFIYFNKNNNKYNIKLHKTNKKIINIDIKDLKSEILNIFNKLKIIEKIEDTYTNIIYNERNKSLVEKIIKDQWYIKLNKLSLESQNLVKKKYISFIPDKYEKIYFNWMNNLTDWCISRQIWWGHKIPAWYDKYNNIYVGKNKKDILIKYNLKNNIKLYRDKDVLDTWFSSSLCVFSFLGWPKNTKKLNFFYPTDIIVSGYDIIFFWISKIIMLSTYIFKNENIDNKIPFKKIYITGLINDKNGKKMSKSNGNVIDPIDIIKGISFKKLINKNIKNSKNNIKNQFPNGINKCGADSLRMYFLSIQSNNKNISFNLEKVYFYKKFCNKLWNLNKFVLKNCKNTNYKKKISIKLFFNKLIISNLNITIKQLINYMNLYKLNKYTKIIFDFVKKDFCDWYIEISKFYLKNTYNNEINFILVNILEIILRLLHPLIPFITEKLWQILKNKFSNILISKEKTIMLCKFPNFNNKYINFKLDYFFKIFKKIIIFFRKEKLLSHKKIIIILNKKKEFEFVKNNKNIIESILKIYNINIIYKKNIFNKITKNNLKIIENNIYCKYI